MFKFIKNSFGFTRFSLEFIINKYLFNLCSSSLLITPINNTGVNREVKGKINSINSPEGPKIHSSFYTILNDKSRGGVLLSNVIYHIHDQNKLNLPLFLTSKGIKASHDLINMINLLPENNNS